LFLRIKELIIRYNLREAETITSFLSSKPPLEKDDAAKAKKEEEENAHLLLLSQLRQKLRILNSSQAEKIFEKIDTNNSGSMVMHEFEDFITYKMPNTEYDVLKKAYEFISGGPGKKIGKEKFAQVMTKEIELVDKDELIYDETQWAVPLM
jgi:hypothetical protein